MKSVAELKSLGDMRTIISTHTRSVPRHKGSDYLDILSLGMEKLRLETELAWLARRERRIHKRQGEIRETMAKALSNAAVEDPAAPEAIPQAHGINGTPHANISAPKKWTKMDIEY